MTNPGIQRIHLPTLLLIRIERISSHDRVVKMDDKESRQRERKNTNEKDTLVFIVYSVVHGF